MAGLGDRAAGDRRLRLGALALDPGGAAAHGNRGNGLEHLGRLDQAQACCRHALALDPDFGEAHNNLGLVLKAEGRAAEAEACFRQALALRPVFTEAQVNLGNALLDRGEWPPQALATAVAGALD